MNLEILLDGMTWGELRTFVAASTEPDSAEVGIAYDMQGDRYGLWVPYEVTP